VIIGDPFEFPLDPEKILNATSQQDSINDSGTTAWRGIQGTSSGTSILSLYFVDYLCDKQCHIQLGFIDTNFEFNQTISNTLYPLPIETSPCHSERARGIFSSLRSRWHWMANFKS